MRFDNFRHAHAEKPGDDSHESDMARPLSEKGLAQVAARREALGNPVYDLVLCSPALRTWQTAVGLSGASPEPVALNELCWQPGTVFDTVMEGLFKELLYAPLKAYRDRDPGGIMDEHGNNAWLAVVHRTQDVLGLEREPRILIVGHAVMANALGYAAVPAGPLAEELAEAPCLGEAEGFSLEAEGLNVTRLTFHRG